MTVSWSISAAAGDSSGLSHVQWHCYDVAQRVSYLCHRHHLQSPLLLIHHPHRRVRWLQLKRPNGRRSAQLSEQQNEKRRSNERSTRNCRQDWRHAKLALHLSTGHLRLQLVLGQLMLRGGVQAQLPAVRFRWLLLIMMFRCLTSTP